MKPLQIGLLVAAGALGGALVMKWQFSRQANMAPTVAVSVEPAAPAAVSTPAQAVAPAEAVPEPPARHLPSPFPEKNKEARRKPGPPAQPAPAVIAQNDMPARPSEAAPPPATAPAPAVTPAPAPPVRSAPPPPTEPAREPAPAPAEPNRVTLAAGTPIPIRLIDGLSTERSQPGDAFTAALDAPLVVDGFVIAERGARVEGKVVESLKAGKVSGVSSLGIVLTRVALSDGQKIALQTETFTKKGDTSHGTDAAKVGGGAALGAIIGAAAGGGKGAGIGAGVGGAAGAGDVLLTRGKPATLPSETRINFRLAAAVTITEKR